MFCPYCNKEMEEGIIRGNRYPLKLKWVAKKNDKIPLANIFVKGVFLKENNTVLGGIHAYYCEDDNIFIIDNNY